MLLEDLAVGPGEDGGITTSGFLAADAGAMARIWGTVCQSSMGMRAGYGLVWRIDAGMARAVAC